MIGSPAPRPRRALVALLSGALVGLTVACAPSTYEIAVETRLPPKLDVTPFQRVLVAGFLVGGDTDVDGNQETVRLLRSQLRTKSGLRVLDADPFSLASVVREQVARSTTQPLPAKIREEKDLEPFTRLFANTAYWKRVGEEYQQPLIVTGAIYFTPQTRSGYVTREVEVVDALGRPHGRATALRHQQGGGALPGPAGDAGTVCVLRTDGPCRTRVSEHDQRPAGQRYARPAALTSCPPIPRCR